jgi:hypothetical protein
MFFHPSSLGLDRRQPEDITARGETRASHESDSLGNGRRLHTFRCQNAFGPEPDSDITMQTPRPDHYTYPPHGGSLDGGYPADKARQGEIILKRPWMRAVFVGGLVATFALGLAATLWS